MGKTIYGTGVKAEWLFTQNKATTQALVFLNMCFARIPGSVTLTK